MKLLLAVTVVLVSSLSLFAQGQLNSATLAMPSDNSVQVLFTTGSSVAPGLLTDSVQEGLERASGIAANIQDRANEAAGMPDNFTPPRTEIGYVSMLGLRASTFSIQPTPEPSSLCLAGFALICIAVFSRRSAKHLA